MGLRRIINAITAGYVFPNHGPKDAKSSNILTNAPTDLEEPPIVNKVHDDSHLAKGIILGLIDDQSNLSMTIGELETINKMSETVSEVPQINKFVTPSGEIKEEYKTAVKLVLARRFDIAFNELKKEQLVQGDHYVNFEKVVALIFRTREFIDEKFNITDEFFEEIKKHRGTDEKIDQLTQDFYITPDQAYFLRSYNGTEE